MDRLDFFEQGVCEVPFDEEVWISGVHRINDLEDPTAFFSFEQKIIEQMVLKSFGQKENGVDEINQVLRVILKTEVIPETKVKPFLIAARQKIVGAAQTLKTLTSTRKNTGNMQQLVSLAQQTHDTEESLKAAGFAGAKLVFGEPVEITYTIPEGRFRNWLRGAKIVKNMMIKNRINIQ